jgi:hypothetical protein
MKPFIAHPMRMGVTPKKKTPDKAKMMACKRGSAVASKVPTAQSMGVPKITDTAPGSPSLVQPFDRVRETRISAMVFHLWRR